MASASPNQTLEQKNRSFTKTEATRLSLERLRGQLYSERATFVPHWQELGRYIFPRRTRFWTTDVDRGNRRNMAIIDSTAGLAARTLRSGMQSGFTSPSRPWFRVTTQDPDRAKFAAIKEWLYDVSWLLTDIFLRSNFYASTQTVYGDMGAFGTAAMYLEEDFDRVIHTYPIVLGSYYLFANDKLQVDGFMRDFRLTVRQVVEKFAVKEGNRLDWTNVSPLIKNLWEAGTTEAWIEMTHAVVPNPNWDPSSPFSDRKRYVSIYYERGTMGGNYSLSDIDVTKVLSISGYDRFPVMAPRWEISGEDIYGTYCPGMEALGDIQALQTMEKRGAQALEKSINPPMVGPASLRNAKATVLPGDITYLDTREGQQKFEPAYMIQPNFQQLELKGDQHRQRIKKCFHEDLWLVISNLQKNQVTAEEIRALQGEKLQEIGPVVDRLSMDFLDPVVQQTFEIAFRQGKLPPPPPDARKQPLKIEYISVMHQAQKALSAGNLERFLGVLGNIRTIEPDRPDILDKVDFDDFLDHYGDAISLPPGTIRDDKATAKVRNQRQKAQEAQQKLAAAEQMSKTAKNLAQAPTDGQPTALSALSQGVQPGGGQ